MKFLESLIVFFGKFYIQSTMSCSKYINCCPYIRAAKPGCPCGKCKLFLKKIKLEVTNKLIENEESSSEEKDRSGSESEEEPPMVVDANPKLFHKEGDRLWVYIDDGII